MIGRIALGGRISITLTLFWAVCVFIFLGRIFPSSDRLEDIVVIMTMPLGLIGGIGEIFGLRGVMGLDEVFSAYVLMIPNAFLLGYGIAACYRGAKRLIGGFHSPNSSEVATLKNLEPAEQTTEAN